ncbi:hypothetical protein [Streptomyces sp. NPDC126522]|uniref:hypothetical protein n=1 Tax=Streptomyces sp. NPDC126522 TaxID=3155211 RepID=UPI003331B636
MRRVHQYTDLLMFMALQHAPRAAPITASRRYAAYVIRVFHAVPDAGSAAPLPPARSEVPWPRYRAGSSQVGSLDSPHGPVVPW